MRDSIRKDNLGLIHEARFRRIAQAEFNANLAFGLLSIVFLVVAVLVCCHVLLPKVNG